MEDHTADPTVGPPRAETIGWDADTEEWEHATLRRAVDHGLRLFNDGAYHEAHDCFEDEWYNYGAGTTESSFLHGMTQVAAGVYKRVDHDDDGGLRSLGRTALDYLEPVPTPFYGVDVAAIRTTLARALDEPSVVDDWRLTLDGRIESARPIDHAYADDLE